MQFTKVHGQGNDFVLVNGFAEHIHDYRQAAITVCDRHFGIGADGLAIILPSQKADFQMRIFNSDGSEAEMCGNVTRCVARYVYEHGLTTKTKIELETLAGIIKPELIFDAGEIKTVRVDMGLPQEQAINVDIALPGQTVQATCVSMGNPHCIVFVEDMSTIDIAAIGPMIEVYPLFPKKTNVEFVQVINDCELRMRVWERGAGITMACGTGASATLVAAVLNGKTSRAVTLHLDGGDLQVEWGADDHVYMSGPAIEVFHGEYPGQLTR